MPHAAGLYYELHGPEDGEALLLSPGLGGSADYWQPNLSAFAERFRVILYDHRGTGRSDRVLPGNLTIDDMAQDVLALLDAIGIARVHFVGHALGGLIGMALALAAPFMEWLQHVLQPVRTYSLGDIGANLAGLALAAAVWYWIARPLLRRLPTCTNNSICTMSRSRSDCGARR